ncbi:SDR family oxidoreductase [Marinomonas primoryensis]|jgi:2-keto-3-deoxy-L-fuconate dehydrogenase|uniref:NAD(P)-dependent dehydrogenase n=1 Tax=Marinomonas primoryensis TaxID=178399 RepID=A0A859CXC6_9GAMM|nr:SDR family oxidoreductase [Marinomonas primoryensis]QKK79049.1 NAD(P)-dependent dehydrogenase [Marinomonas primoryensis]|tara:strand:- start:92187 stop:92957 length:771 start_codon:yes stop_codon:yes gene_type:complete
MRNGETIVRLKGKTILITAAGQGIGRASAEACLREGANVIATDINKEALQKLQSDCPQIQTHLLDVTDSNAIKAFAKTLPNLDGLFNCAGFVHNGTVLDISDEDWDFSMNLNVTSMMRMCRTFLPGMLEQAKITGSSSIVNMASMASSIKGFPMRTAYGASKAAVIGLTKGIAADFVKKGIRCNSVNPGTVNTPSLQGRISSAPDPVQAEKDFIARQPMGRLAEVDDITPMVVFLLSDESLCITGQSLSVDGGVTI